MNLAKTISNRSFAWADIAKEFPTLPSKENLPSYLSRQCPDGFQVWGVTEKEKSIADKMKRGDYLFLIERMILTDKKWTGSIPFCCRVLHPSFSSANLAKTLWDSPTFLHIILLKAFNINLHWEEFARTLGYEESHQPQNFKRYSPEVRWKKKDWNKNVAWDTPSDYVKFLIETVANSTSSLESHTEPAEMSTSQIDLNSEDNLPNAQTGSNETQSTNSWSESDYTEIRIEGGRVKRTVFVNERDPKIVEMTKLLAEETDDLRCEICDASFYATYGPHGEGFIEAHHRIPFDGQEREIEMAPEAIKKYIALLCSNCHRMIHRKRNEPITVDELKRIWNDHNSH